MPVGPLKRRPFLSAGDHERIPVSRPCCRACFHNEGNYVISRQPCRWLGQQAEAPALKFHPGFAGAEVLYDDGAAYAAWRRATWASVGTAVPGPIIRPGWNCSPAITVFAEGCVGTSGQAVERVFACAKVLTRKPMASASGNCGKFRRAPQPGLVLHSAGWPLEPDTYGGGFIIRPTIRVAVDFVVGSATPTPIFHPMNSSASRPTRASANSSLAADVSPTVPSGAIAGGLQSFPRLTFPGGILQGDDAGFSTQPASRAVTPH